MLAIDPSWSRIGAAALLSVNGGAHQSAARQQALIELNLQANWGRSATMREMADGPLKFFREYEEYLRRHDAPLGVLSERLTDLSDRIDAAKAKYA